MQFRSARVSCAAVLAGLALVTPAVDATAQPDPTNAEAKYAAALADNINAHRAGQRLKPLALDAKLDGIAHAHSVAMATAGRMSHDAFPQRVRATGFAMCIENVGWNYPSPQAQLDAWRASPGHAANLASTGVESMGVGMARGYVTFIACGS